ncbi:MAG: hypothetical protein A3H17_03925 [Candidatus Levybacteria bacterium RIFCSPLOWO2_12_FULL_37_14]|nr:MAG: hypothetical protein A3H17_03925 [Candidatus Levybacteria bacterium RIFCSPLOWO2_12_FULL_37_14]
MPEFEVTEEQAKAIRKWADKRGQQVVSGTIDKLGSLNIINKDPLLIMGIGFKNIEGAAVSCSDVLTSKKVVTRMKASKTLLRVVPSIAQVR